MGHGPGLTPPSPYDGAASPSEWGGENLLKRSTATSSGSY